MAFWASSGGLALLVCAALLGWMGRAFYYIMTPMARVDLEQAQGPWARPAWPEDPRVDVRVVAASALRGDGDAQLVWQASNVSVRADMEEVAFEALLEDDGSAPRLWAALRGNGTAFLHVAVTRAGADPRAPMQTLQGALALVRHMPRRGLDKRFLLSGGPSVPEAVDENPVAHWKPAAHVRLVLDRTEYPLRQMPATVGWALKASADPAGERGDRRYVPVLHVDEMALTNDMLLPLNASVRALPLSVSLGSLSVARWQLLAHMEFSLRTMEWVDEADRDELRHVIADTNVWLLGVTMAVSVVHLVFDVLALKSDVEYWRDGRGVEGLSARSVVAGAVCETVVLAFLVDQDASLLVTAPAAASGALAWWKAFKVRGRLGAAAAGSVARYDRVATGHLSLALAPVILGMAAYSLVYQEQRGWYSWALGSLTATVYGLGFILMTPQLYINYKLRSVAHLPWRLLVYRALNTFIDDLFAFIIRQPTMTRVSAFRDDVVFLIYLYQRRIYPEDKTRAAPS